MEALGVNLSADAGATRRLPVRSGHCVFVCSGNSFGHEVRTDGAAGPEGPNCVQFAGAAYQSGASLGSGVGVYSIDLVDKLAEALSMLGLRRALVVHGK